MRSWIPWLTAALIVLADRLTKMAVLRQLEHGQWHEVFPGFTITHVRNPGIAFSLFADGGPFTRVLLHLVILTAVVVIAWMVVRHGQRRILSGLAFGFILGGAVGNLIDRVIYGWVLDFIHVWVRVGGRTWAWPDFNVADSAITTGAIILILFEIFRPEADDAPDSD
ncbi:MAG: signal peptidase II [Thermoanaerobaculales bacterium]|jgi:signal peptidase II|nr:signal peptidase II [Thermoanaerobaculales bacterium]